MKVFLTGNKGYVGNVLAKKLVEENFDVVGCDLEFFPQKFTNSDIPQVRTLKKDIRDLIDKDLQDCDVVLHLAGLSNDPLGELNPALTNEINFLATVKLAKLAKDIGIERFVFSSSCSTYGSTNDVVDENSRLSPLTAYAKSKVDSERELIKLKDDKFMPIILRNATVYGVSPSQRLDLVVNNLVCSAITTGKIKLLSDGTAWRPILHVEDMADAFIHMLKTGNNVAGQCFNVGSNDDNFSVREIAEEINKEIPESEIEYPKEPIKDKRSYKVNFDKIHNIGYKTKWNLKDGIVQIVDAIKNQKFKEENFNDKAFYRMKYIKWLIESGVIDKNLKFTN